MAGVTGEIEERVAQYAATFVAGYHWQTVKVEILAQQVMAKIAAGARLQEAHGLERLCEKAAAVQLYEAYMQSAAPAAGSREQRLRQAVFQDLANYLDGAARRMSLKPAPDTPWDHVIQDTLVELDKQISVRKDPQDFLALVVGVLARRRAETWRTFRRRVRREQPFDATVVGRYAHEARSSEGDENVYSMIGSCVENDRQRLIALGFCMGLKRRSILLLLGNMKGGDYDNLYRAMLKRLFDCEQFQNFLYRHWRPALR